MVLIVFFLGGGNASYGYLLRETRKDFLDSQYEHQDEIFIPSLGLRAPFVEASSWTGEQIFSDLRKGIVLLPTFGWLPGDKMVMTAHSSGYITDKQPFIFSGIGGLENGADIFMWHDNKLKKYVVQDRKVVSPYNVKVLTQEKDQTLTLVTCWPVGDNSKRILVIADKKL